MKVISFACCDAVVKESVEFKDHYLLKLKVLSSNVVNNTIKSITIPKPESESGLNFAGKCIRMREIVEMEE